MGRFKFFIFGISLIIAIGSITTYWIISKTDSFGDEIISNTSDTFKDNLVSFLVTVNHSVDEINSNTDSILTDIPNMEKLNGLYSEMILSDRYLEGVALSNEKYSYIIYREKSTWATTFDINLMDSTSEWKRLNNNLEVVSEWTDVATSYLSQDNIVEIHDKLKSSQFIWNVNDSPVPELPNMLSVVFNAKDQKGSTITTGLIYNTKNISRDFVSVLKYDKPLVSILTDNRNFVTPILTTDSSSIKIYGKLRSQIENILANWHNNDSLKPSSYSFEMLNQIFWTRIVALQPRVGISGFAVTISAEDLAGMEKKQEQKYLYISILFALLSIIIFIFKLRKPKVNKEKITKLEIPTKEELLEIIGKGETEYVEFKSSLRWDYRQEIVNKVLENVILKSINAFANAKGGKLIIGVDDEMQILGLQNDFNTLKKKDADYFELHLRKLINNQYGIAFSNENLSMSFYDIDGDIICLIQIVAAESPVFLKTKNKQGAEIEKFYVRSGNASQEISSLTEINEYINIRFDK